MPAYTDGSDTSLEPAEHLQVKASIDNSKHIILLCNGSNSPTPQRNSPATSPQELHFNDSNVDLDEMTEGNNFSVGRPSEATLDMIQEGLDHISTYLADLAAHTGQPLQQIIDCFLKRYAQLIPLNDWN